MKKVNLFFSTVALGAVILAGASVTEAGVYCGCTGKVVYTSFSSSTSGGSASGYVYLQPEHTVMPGYYCYAYVPSGSMYTLGNQLVASATGGHNEVYVAGYNSSATSCDTDSARYLGTLYYVSMRPRY